MEATTCEPLHFFRTQEYVRSDGFLTGTGFNGGDGIPYGSYDAARGAWSAEPNGSFIRIDNDDTTNCTLAQSPPEENSICADASFPIGTYLRLPDPLHEHHGGVAVVPLDTARSRGGRVPGMRSAGALQALLLIAGAKRGARRASRQAGAIDD